MSQVEYAIVGGGIAGLATAEILARSGKSVVLIERNGRVCQEASAAQHGWFHFGSLYSIFPQNQFLRTMLGGVEDLLNHYCGFPAMNIGRTVEGRLTFPQFDNCWFRDEPIEYIVCARNDPDFDLRTFEGVRSHAHKLYFLLTWEMAIKQFISRHQRFHSHNWGGAMPASSWIPRAGWADYSREVITKPDNVGVNLDRDTHFRIVGFDRPMQAEAIITDLVRSLIGSGGNIVTGAGVEKLEKTGARVRVHTNGRTIEAKRVILGVGKSLGRFLKEPVDVKVSGSPLLVAYPAVSDINFVRLTPFVEKSINHLQHRVGSVSYSLIGGGYFADPNDLQAVARASERLVSMAMRVFPRLRQAKVLETYIGYKTEISTKLSERNYQYFIRDVDDGIHAIVPGKFSLAFSLAVNTFRRLTGEEPNKSVRLAARVAADPYIGLTRHAALLCDRLKGVMDWAPSAST